MSARDLMATIDARIFGSRIAGDQLEFGTNVLRGKFIRQPREVEMPGGGLRVVQLTFECRYDSDIASLAIGDEVTVQGWGNFRFLGELIPGGDESGFTVIELGTQL